MSSERFEDLLKATMGLDVASIGTAAMAHAVRQRQRACHAANVQAYWDRVCESGAELQQLIEAVVVPETWFFRDREVFAAIGRIACTEWLAGNREGILRLLSLPCSTGEEPYSVAMALLDAGFPMDRCRIDAVDINAQALERGRRGHYRHSSFRGDEAAFRDRHFTPADAGHQLADHVRRHVRFQQGNVFAADFLPGAEIYDAILCRNMMIYFDRPTQARVAGILARLLKPHGLLFVGAAETGVLGADFVSARIARTSGFRKAAGAPREERANAVPARRRPVDRRPAPPLPTAERRHAARTDRPAASATGHTFADRRSSVDEARTLADQGRLVEAALRCEQEIRQHGPSADVFHLLGLVRDASGNHLDAAVCYRKALYLDPNHREALAHLALLMEDQGRPEARALRNRIKRLEQQGRP